MRRYSKADGSWINVAGTASQGYVDWIGAEAWFSDVVGLGSDGTNIWVADGTNYRVRKGAPASSLPSAQPASATSTLGILPGWTRTFAGSGTSATVDGTGTAASFKSMEGIVAVNGFAYVAATTPRGI